MITASKGADRSADTPIRRAPAAFSESRAFRADHPGPKRTGRRGSSCSTASGIHAT